MHSLLWGDTHETKKFHLVSWDKICVPRVEGGLSIRSFKDMSTAGTISNLWAITTEKESLWIRWIHSKYLEEESIWSVAPKNNDH